MEAGKKESRSKEGREGESKGERDGWKVEGRKEGRIRKREVEGERNSIIMGQ